MDVVGCRQGDADEVAPMVSAVILKASGDVVGDPSIVERMLTEGAQAEGASMEIKSNSVTRWKGNDARTVHYVLRNGPASATGWIDFVPVKKDRIVQITRAIPHAEEEDAGRESTEALSEMAATLDVIDPSGGSGLKPSRMLVDAGIVGAAIGLMRRYQRRNQARPEASDA